MKLLELPANCYKDRKYMNNNTPVPDFMRMAHELLKDLPREVAGMALKHFNDSFVKEGFTDNSFIAWPKRLDDLTFATHHPILNKTGALMRSLVIRSATMDKIEIAAGDGLPYAAIHNNGGVIKIKITDKMRKYFWFIYISLTKHYANGGNPPDHILKWKMMALTKKTEFTVHIAKKQFIGNSEVLMKDIDKHIVNKIITTFKSVNKPV